MRIIGGHDYYDTALSFGHDTHIAFVRESNRCMTDREVACPIGIIALGLTDGRRAHHHLRLSTVSHDYQLRRKHYAVARITVIFCGKIHRGLSVTTQSESRLGELIVVYFWHAEQFHEWLAELGLRVERGGRLSDSDAVERLFATEPVSAALLDWLITNKVVVAIRMSPPAHVNPLDHPTWEINSDRLGDLQFYRKLHAFEAFQEIDMWVGGVLPGESNDTVQIDDKTRIAKHGFDKASFRRAKQS